MINHDERHSERASERREQLSFKAKTLIDYVIIIIRDNQLDLANIEIYTRVYTYI